MNLQNLFAELKRRNVYKVAITYGVVAWLLIQIATQVFPFFEIPNWTVRLVVLLIMVGFPIALIIGWAFELTPKGLKRTEVADATPALRSPHRAWIYDFAEGVQDEILTRLAKVADLKVISRTSTQKYKSAPDNLREIAKQLGVSNILEGSV